MIKNSLPLATAVLLSALIAFPANSQTIDKHFYDNFLDNALGWSQPPDAEFTFANMSLLFDNKVENLSASWQGFDLNPPGTIVAVWTTHSSGSSDMPYGLSFGGSDYDNQYFFFISADGYYKIGKFEKGDWGEIVAWTPSDVIFTGQNAGNHLKIKIRSTWEFYINGALVHTMPAKPLFGGNAGLIVEGIHAVTFEKFLVGYYKSGLIDNEFTRIFAPLIDDYKNEFANSKGITSTTDTSEFADLFREWAVKDPLPHFQKQKIFRFTGMCYVGTYGFYPTQSEAVDAFLKVQDWINYMRTDALLWDSGEKLEDGVISSNMWFALDAITGEKSPYEDIIIALTIHKPEGSRKEWELQLQVLHRTEN